MRELGRFEAKDTLGSLLDRVEHGDFGEARAAAQRILDRSKGVTLGGASLKELIEEGRP